MELYFPQISFFQMTQLEQRFFIELNYGEKKVYFGAFSYYLIDEWLKKLTKARNFYEWLEQLKLLREQKDFKTLLPFRLQNKVIEIVQFCQSEIIASKQDVLPFTEKGEYERVQVKSEQRPI